jgi:hypothetical protein
MNIDHARRVLEHQEKQMANELQPLSNLPAHVRARQLARNGTKIDAVIPGGSLPNHVSIRGNRFTMIRSDGEQLELPTMYFDCLIVGHNPHMSQSYYEKAFDVNALDYGPPDCWADNGYGPGPQVTTPQSESCAVCDKKKWGSSTSKLTGKAVPACQAARKLAVFFGDTLYQLKVTPGSFANWNSYNRYLAPQGSKNPLSYEDVITRVSFQSGSTGVLKFDPIPGNSPYVPVEAYEMMEKIVHEAIYREVLSLGEPEKEEFIRPKNWENNTIERPADPVPLKDGNIGGWPPPADVEATKAPKRRKPDGGVQAPQEAPPAPESMASKVSEAFGFKFNR